MKLAGGERDTRCARGRWVPLFESESENEGRQINYFGVVCMWNPRVSLPSGHVFNKSPVTVPLIEILSTYPRGDGTIYSRTMSLSGLVLRVNNALIYVIPSTKANQQLQRLHHGWFRDRCFGLVVRTCLIGAPFRLTYLQFPNSNHNSPTCWRLRSYYTLFFTNAGGPRPNHLKATAEEPKFSKESLLIQQQKKFDINTIQNNIILT